MKTIDQINQEIQELCTFVANMEKSYPDKSTKKYRNKITFLRKCILYLETSPRQEFIESEVNRVKELIVKTTPEFPPEFTKQTIKKTLKELGVDKMKSQLTMLNYLLRWRMPKKPFSPSSTWI